MRRRGVRGAVSSALWAPIAGAIGGALLVAGGACGGGGPANGTKDCAAVGSSPRCNDGHYCADDGKCWLNGTGPGATAGAGGGTGGTGGRGGAGGSTGGRGGSAGTVGTGGTIPLVRLNLTIIDDACGSTYGASGIATTTAGGGVCSITNSSSSLRSVACAWNVPQGDLVSIQGTVNASVFAGQGLACGADATYSGSCQSGSSGTCVCTFTMSAARSVVMSICHGG